MNITAGLIIYSLSLDTTIRTNIGTEDDFEVSSYELWEKGMPQKQVLYIVEKERLLKDLTIWQGRFVLCVGWLEEQGLKEQGINWICVSGSIGLYEILGHVQRIFHKYYQWYIRLGRMLRKKENLNDILEDFDETYRIMACISSESMRILGSSSRFEKAHSWIDGQGMVTLGLVNELVADEEFQDAAEYEDVFLYYNINQEWYYCYNIKKDGQYEARLLGCAETHQKMHGIRKLIGDLGECLSDMYEEYFGEGQNLESGRELHEMICGMIQGVTVNLSDLRRLLSRYHWEVEQQYQVILFQFQEGVSGGVGMAYYKAQIRKLFHDCYVVEEKDRFICIRNLSRSENKGNVYEKNLPYFLRETLCKAGISNVFCDFSCLHRYCLEAERALLIGERTDSTKWYYYFPKYVIPYLMEQCTRELHAEQVCHPAIAILQEYDQKNETHLLESLRVYLRESHSITHTAEILEVHRTTLLVRLDRIRQLTGIDFDDYDTCFHLMISFEIRKWEMECYKI